MGELLAVVLLLEAEQTLPLWAGRSAQAWFLNTIRRVDSALADKLHASTAGGNRRPYTLSVTAEKSSSEFTVERSGSDKTETGGNPRATDVFRKLSEPLGSDKTSYRNKYVLRITSVSATLTNVLLESLIPLVLDTNAIPLNGGEVQIKKVCLDNHPWCGRSSFEELGRENLIHLDNSIQGFHCEFATPTAFHQQGLTVPLPLPALVFGSLIQAWDQFSPLPLPLTMGGFVERHIGISRHRISTRLVKLGKSEQHIGFVGDVHYHIVADHADLTPDDFRQRVRLLALLSQFAFYVGVGIRTTVGMGQVRTSLK